MTKYFENCKTAEELKKAYKKMAAKLHPDNNPAEDTTKDFQEMQAEFQTAFEKLKNVHVNKDGEEYEKETTETAGEFMELINKLLHFPDIEVELCGSWIWVSGETKAVKVYSLIRENGVDCVKEFDGWTFEKFGFTFDVRKDENRRYIIMLHDTGLKCAMADKKSQVPLEITPTVIKLLNAPENQERISEAENHCKKLMIKTGYIQPEKCQEKQEEKDMQEEKKNVVEYSITGTGSVLMFVVIGEKENGRLEKQRVVFAPDHPDYNAVLSAAIRYGCKRPENIPRTAPAEEKADAMPKEDVSTEESRNPKAARGPVPEKAFIGQTLQGNGWKIYFDGVESRTRVIFSIDPSKKAIKAVEDAGFYYSSKMNSWNKKLTFKAYRAAQKLAQELTKACGNAA